MFHRYLATAAITGCVCLLLVAAVNVVVDPHLAFRVISTPQLDSLREHATGRAPKAEQAARGDDAILFLGDSRTLVGLNPRHPRVAALGDAFNLAVAGGTPDEALRLLELRQQHEAPRLVIWGLDPELLNTIGQAPLHPEALDSRLNPQLSLPGYYRPRLIGKPVLFQSLEVLANALLEPDVVRFRAGQQVVCHPPGRDQPAEFIAQLSPAAATAADCGPHEIPEQLSDGLARLQQSGTRILLFIPPTHATRLELQYRRPGGTERLLSNTRLLVECVERLNSIHTGCSPIEIWDFRGFTDVHAEPVPGPGDSRRMHWHWESLHVSAEFGDLILDCMLGGIIHSPPIGVRLSSENLSEHFAGLQRQRAQYVQQHPEQTRIVSAAMRRVE